MRGQERLYRVLLLAHPRSHRRQYGEAMIQLMRDRVRDDGGGLRTLLVWCWLLGDLARSAMIERVTLVHAEFRSGWWRVASVGVAAVLAFAGISSLFDPATGPWYKYTFGRLVLLAAPVVIGIGLQMRTRRRAPGSALVAVGLLPGAAAIVLFWWPPFLVFGLLSMAVMIGAINDAENARRAALADPFTGAPASPAVAWPSAGDQGTGST